MATLTGEDGRMRTLTASVGALVSTSLLLASLAGCTGGSSGDSVSVSGNVSVAYIRRPVAALGNPTDSVISNINGGALLIRDVSSPSGTDTDITQPFTLGRGDVSDPEVSYDGRKLLFAMRCSAQSAPQCYNYQGLGNDFSWNIWEYDIPSRTMRKVIADPAIAARGNDVDPAYLPDGRIVFSSSRQSTSIQDPAGGTPGAVGYVYTDEYEREPVTVLHVMNNDGSNITQISFNQSHDRNPVVLSTGEIMYSRWDHVGGRNQFSIFKINPDGSDFFVLYGAHSPGNSYLHPREMPDGRVMSTLMPLSGTREGGSLEIIDIQNYSENDDPATQPGPVNQLGERAGQFQVSRLMLPGESAATHAAMRGQNISPLGRYSTSFPLWDRTNRVLVAYTPSQPTTEFNPFLGQNVQVEGTPRYGIWMLNLDSRTLNVVVPPVDGYLLSDPVAIQARPVPGIKPTTPLDEATTGTGFGILNVKSVYDTDSRGRMGPEALATGECIPRLSDPSQCVNGSDRTAALATIKHPANPQFGSRPARFFRITKSVPTPGGLDRETIGEEEFEMQQIIGYGVIEPDGSMTARVPANTPVTITALDSQGRGFTHHTNWIQTKPGETRTCNGCHSPRRGSAINTAPITGNHPQAGDPGESMSETRFIRVSNTVADLTRDPGYTDVWTGMYNTRDGTAIAPESSNTISYDDLNGAGHVHGTIIPSPVRARNGATCNGAAWSPVNCAIVINYETHIQPVFENHCVSCHSGGAPAGELDLSSTRSAIFGRLNSYQELLVGDPVLVNGLPVISIDPDDGEIIIQREPALVNAGNSRSSTLIERIFEQELLAGGTACISDGAGGCTNGLTNHANMLNAAEKRQLTEWADVGAQYYNDPFDGSGNVRSSRELLNFDVFAATVFPILVDPANPAAGCAGCHRAFGGNGTSGGASNPNFSGNRYVLTGNIQGDFNATASMVTDVCTPANSYLLVRPSGTMASNPPHPEVPTGSGTAALPAGSANYNAILAWISAAGAGASCP
jgi:hypothetical protein